MSHSVFSDIDMQHMRRALVLARRGLGMTAPNPSVGCILVSDGKIIGRGHTQPGGRPHAETVALAAAGAEARGSTAYVTLEPCDHTGQTGPCSEALIAAGVARVVVATADPDPRVNGGGIERLRRHGIEVAVGCCEAEARRVTAGFLSVTERGRPYVSLKLATSLDGKIALANGESQWITGPEARMHGHMLRAQNDAIMVGAGTVLADDPSLTCRIAGLEAYSPLAVVLDERLEIPLTSALVVGAVTRPLVVVCGAEARTGYSDKYSALEAAGAMLLPLEKSREPGAVLEALSRKHGITRLLIEGGARVSAAYVRAGVVDEIYHYQAGKIIGADGLSAIAALEFSNLGAVPNFNAVKCRTLGNDVLRRYAL